MQSRYHSSEYPSIIRKNLNTPSDIQEDDYDKILAIITIIEDAKSHIYIIFIIISIIIPFLFIRYNTAFLEYTIKGTFKQNEREYIVLIMIFLGQLGIIGLIYDTCRSFRRAMNISLDEIMTYWNLTTTSKH